MPETTIDDAINIVRSRFDSNDFIDLTALKTISVIGNPTLEDFFFGLPGTTIGEMLSKGIAHLRPGLYKIVNPPVYRTDITPNTFAADVLYLKDFDKRVIRFQANIGPMTNSKVRYIAPDYKTNALHEPFKLFCEERALDDPKNFFIASKNHFFKKLYNEDRIFAVQKSELKPAVPPDTKSFRVVEWRLLT